MNRIHPVALGLAVYLAGPNARAADALSRNTEAAKLAHDKAQQWKSATAQKLVDQEKQLNNLWKTFEGAVASPEASPWWTKECSDELNELLDTSKTRLDSGKLPSEPLVNDAIQTLAKATNPKKPQDLDPQSPARQKAILWGVCGALQGERFKDDCQDRLKQINSSRAQIGELRAAIQRAGEEKKSADAVESYTRQAYETANVAERNAVDTPVSALTARLAGVRRARCATAYCWGGDDGREMAIEPILDLPVGMYWAAGGSALADYVNANNIKIQFNAGLRYWFAYDVMSVGILLAQPDLTGNHNTISFRGKPMPASQMRRPYPTLVIGFGADILQVSISYDELRNASSDSSSLLPEFRPNQTLSRAVVIGVAISPLTAARNGIAASSAQAKEAGK